MGMYRSEVRSSYSMGGEVTTTGAGGITPGGRGGAEIITRENKS
jgi:hypothetical protein